MNQKQNAAIHRVGILGAGQLGLFLAEAAKKLGVDPLIFASDKNEPAVHTNQAVSFGKLNNRSDVELFTRSIDQIAIESELIPDSALRAIEGSGKKTCPSINVIATCRNKLRQKEVFQRAGLQTAPWISCVAGVDVQTWLKEARDKFGNGYVLKWAMGGYDGKGVLVISNHQSVKPNVEIEFVERALAHNIEVYAEERIDFVQELAIICTRKTDHELVYYPLILSENRHGICWTVKGPAVQFGLAEEIEIKAGEYSKVLGKFLDVTGTFALELFLTKSQQLIINEMAPRVHNSGHFSLDASAASQFENHMRVVLGMPLIDPKPAACFAMVNLLGPDGFQGETAPIVIGDIADTKVYWYGKKQCRPGRKMGHVNLWEKTPALLNQKLEGVQMRIEKYWQRVKGEPT